ncbi:uncharacterized protein AC631_01714 [Debaryomyces fabryi]|uniref:Oxo-4-hydroxy-4-carboxy-5-ureidoimidazoline decarboxylase domain-containing protein n=1 Tax=Debaryomyces fabryi TaxID=58627 RepID=A0A0V1Q1Z2_9ASCO|nr:uncharacterized protein AC631_01714 [Debaryomyces fabryi]KSA02539.1 hypothetical protein AC631_01714 [Debaryomyces fabryi]CUM47715.1 unnamed protein product [Debaryomyces fabryi]
MSYILPPANQLSTLPRSQLIEVFNHLFEPCPTLTSLLISKIFNGDRTYSSYPEMIEACREELTQFLGLAELEAYNSGTAINPDISKIIAAHPRLGRSAPNKSEKLSTHSSEEQKSLQGSEEEARRLTELNEQYETTFPGLRYVVFVNGRPRSDIMQNMKERINRNKISLERRDSFNAMCDIALDRAKKLNSTKL